MSTPVHLPPSDPKANFLAHRDEIEAAIDRVLESGRFILGEEVAAFEKEFAAYTGVRHAVGVGNGTDALHIALRACNIGPGDAVITVSHTAVATVAAIELCGATPVLVDIEPTTFTMDPNSLDESVRKLTSHLSPSAGRLKAVIPVHLYGHPADMPAIMEIARRYHLWVIEDCAQSHGAALEGRRTGSWGCMAAFSFYPTKNLGAIGDGGMVLTNDSELAEQARLLREHGWRERYVSIIPGMNSRLDELQAAILREKLRHLDKENARRQKLAAVYDTLLCRSKLALPKARPDAAHVYHQYVVRTPGRDALRVHLQERGIETLVHYPVPIHLQPAYRGRLPVVASLQQTEEVVRRILSLPIYPELSEDHLRTIAGHVLAWERGMHLKD